MRLIAIAAGILFIGSQVHAEGFEYVGVKKCKICHRSKKIGNQYGVWEESLHQNAFESLKSDTAKKVAAAMGIEDPTKSEACLKCHTTGFAEGGYDLEKEAETNAIFEGVQCEACHGPGSKYKSLKVMKAVAAGETKPEEVGLIVPKEEDCKKCHTPEGNSFYKEFNFEEFFKKIAHPVPKD